MTIVDHIYSGSLTSIVGPSGTIRRILKNSSILKREGIDVSVYNNGIFYKDWEDREFSAFRPKAMSHKHQLKLKMDVWAKNSRLLSVALMEYSRYCRKKTVKAYLRLKRNADIVVFHSDLDAFFYFSSISIEKAKTACFFHSDSLPMEMFFQYYPKLRGTSYARRMVDNYKYVVEKIDRCVFICQKGQENMNNMFPVSIPKSALVINGIDDISESQRVESDSIAKERNDNKIKLVSVGSVSLRKGDQSLYLRKA